MEESREMGAQERAALAVYLVLQRPQTTASIARRCGMTADGARRMLYKISRAAPIFYDDFDGCWRMCEKKDPAIQPGLGRYGRP